ncbi:MAG: hypothetical protein R2788_06105 [Saprospiraceae bacterium]
MAKENRYETAIIAGVTSIGTALMDPKRLWILMKQHGTYYVRKTIYSRDVL